mgnify:CR=1 FL=1
MKNIMIISTILITAFSCKAQQVQPRYTPEGYARDNIYYKDVDNDYNCFEGTWIYTNGNTSLTVTLQKKVMKLIQDDSHNFYIDAIIGEYKYIEDGIVIINTLSNLSQNHENPYKYNITGGTISKNQDPLCSNCDPDDIKVICSFSDPERDILGMEANFIMRHYTENGVEKIAVVFRGGGMIASDPERNPQGYTSYSLPFGEYALIKQ